MSSRLPYGIACPPATAPGASAPWTPATRRRARRLPRHAPGQALLELFQRARPVLAQEARERAVGEEPPTGLADRTVVRLVLRVDDPLHRRPAVGTRLAVATVDRHALAKAVTFSGTSGAPSPKTLDPLGQHVARRRVEPRDLLSFQLVRHPDGRQPRPVQDLVRVGVADAVEKMGVGEGALERVALVRQRLAKLGGRRLEDVEPAGVVTRRARPPPAPGGSTPGAECQPR